jgi:hypothetical protein
MGGVWGSIAYVCEEDIAFLCINAVEAVCHRIHRIICVGVLRSYLVFLVVFLCRSVQNLGSSRGIEETSIIENAES